MTDSTTEDAPGEHDFEAGPCFDELFGPIADDSLDEPTSDGNAVPKSSTIDRDDESTTDVFDRLKADESADADAVLENDRPSAIIESADDPSPTTEDAPIDAAVLVDEDTLAELLLPDRTEGGEFRWVETNETASEATVDAASTEPAADDQGATDAERRGGILGWILAKLGRS